MLAINTDYVHSSGNPEPYLKQIAESNLTHIQWLHHWNSDFMYGPHEVAQIKRWLDEYGLVLNDLHASDGQEKYW
ncbi:MAG: sugar phosphate isomerase/epimerase, partial [Chloroflexota bacterium]